MTALRDLTGQTFGRFSVVRLYASKPTRWLCLCSCGAERAVLAGNLCQGFSKSCGCLKKDLTVARFLKHGQNRHQAASAEYKVWGGMLVRARGRASQDRYAHRGIGVVERWESFENFLADMGRRPTPKHSIDRINNDQGYSPWNCRWATAKEQARNRRSSRMVTAFGERLSVAEWVEKTGIPHGRLVGRLNNGWDPERALSVPFIPQSQRRIRKGMRP